MSRGLNFSAGAAGLQYLPNPQPSPGQPLAVERGKKPRVVRRDARTPDPSIGSPTPTRFDPVAVFLLQVGSGALREAVLRARRSADVGLDEDAVGEDVLAEGFTGLAGLAAPREDEDDDAVPDYLLDLLQSHRNQERLGEDFILGYHDDYRERYDGFDQPPPFRRHKRASTEPAAAEAAARRTLRASDLEISEEEAFSTRVFVTTPRRQR